MKSQAVAGFMGSKHNEVYSCCDGGFRLSSCWIGSSPEAQRCLGPDQRKRKIYCAYFSFQTAC